MLHQAGRQGLSVGFLVQHASSPCAVTLLFEAGSFREAVDEGGGKEKKKKRKSQQQVMAAVLRQLGRQQIGPLETTAPSCLWPAVCLVPLHVPLNMLCPGSPLPSATLCVTLKETSRHCQVKTLCSLRSITGNILHLLLPCSAQCK